MKIIFLDTDGVLNGFGCFTKLMYDIARKLGLLRKLTRVHSLYHLKKSMIQCVISIVNQTGAKIVLIGSSVPDFWSPTEYQSKEYKFLVNYLSKYSVEILTSIDSSLDKNAGIQDFLKNEFTPGTITNYIIIDDERSAFPDFDNNHIVCTASKLKRDHMWYEGAGLKPHHIAEAVRKLNQ